MYFHPGNHRERGEAVPKSELPTLDHSSISVTEQLYRPTLASGVCNAASYIKHQPSLGDLQEWGETTPIAETQSLPINCKYS